MSRSWLRENSIAGRVGSRVRDAVRARTAQHDILASLNSRLPTTSFSRHSIQRFPRLGPLQAMMQRESRDILLTPYRVEFAHYRKGQPTEWLILDCANDAGSTWQPTLATLNAGLQKLAWLNADVRVRLSNHFVRYALVPTVTQLRNRDERMAAARHHLSAVYGERAERWQVALNDSGRGNTAIAAGTDQDFMQQLVTALANAKLTLLSVEPLMATEFNASRRDISRAPTWFCIAEPGRIALAYIENHEWKFLHVERLRGNLADELGPLLERTQMAQGVKPGRVLMVSDAAPKVELLNSAGWSLDWRPLSAADTARPMQ